MTLSLPSRLSRSNVATAVAAPASVRLIATRTAGADRPEVVLAADVGDMTRDGMRAHALQVLAAIAERFPAAVVDVQLLDATTNVPMLIVTQGGAL